MRTIRRILTTLLAASTLLVGAGCRHFCPPQTIKAWPTEPQSSQASEPAATSRADEALQAQVEEPEPTAVERADDALRRGDYPRAADLYRQVLRDGIDGPELPHAMLGLAIVQLLPSGTLHDEKGARLRLRRLVARYPESAERATAEALLALGDQADGLRRQLDELKRIDLGRSPAPSPR